jgi:hypothetical protein
MLALREAANVSAIITAEICKQRLREKYPDKLGLVEEFIVEIEGPPNNCDLTRWGKFTDIRDIKKEMFQRGLEKHSNNESQDVFYSPLEPNGGDKPQDDYMKVPIKGAFDCHRSCFRLRPLAGCATSGNRRLPLGP